MIRLLKRLFTRTPRPYFFRPPEGHIIYSALEQNMMAAVLIDARDRIVFFSRAAETLWGISREDVLGHNVSRLIPHNIRYIHSQFIRRNRQGGEPRVAGMSRELQLERSDGTRVWTRFALSKVDVSGEIYYLALARDASRDVAQQEQSRLLLLAVNHLNKAIIVLDASGVIVQCNQAFTDISGTNMEMACGKNLAQVLNIPDSPPGNRSRLWELLRRKKGSRDEIMVTSASGEALWLRATATFIPGAERDRGENCIMTFSDVTEERKIRTFEHAILAAMCSTPPFEEICALFCRTIESTLGNVRAELTIFAEGAYSPDTAGTGQGATQTLLIRRRNGQPAGMLSLSTTDGKGLSPLACSIADISQHLAALMLDQEFTRQHIEHLIKFDPLTGLPNRSHMQSYLDARLSLPDSPAPQVFFIEIDHFQDIIDTHGYAIAEQIIVKVVSRLSSLLTPGQYLSKTEGPQFVLIDHNQEVTGMTRVAKALVDALRVPVIVEDHQFTLTLSIGISHESGRSSDWLLSTAHAAAEHIRRTGGNDWHFFRPELNRAVADRLLLGAALRRAIASNHLRLVYQPQIWASTGKIYGYEALARWYDPEHGEIPPSQFIPLAEEIGEIENIGRWVVREACRQLAEWHKHAVNVPTVSVNLSAMHFRSSQLLRQVSEALEEFSIPGQQLTLEITESMMMEQDDVLLSRIQTLRNLGVGVSVDDFGTGFSGLSRLMTIPATEIKIDRSFISVCVNNDRSRSLLDAINGIGQSFHLTVVAEGVEFKEQFDLIKRIGNMVVQGYYISPPLPASRVSGWSECYNSAE